METSSSAVTTGITPAATSTWAIDPSHSAVEFSVKHMMVATTKGRFNGVSGTLVIDNADLTRSHAEITIDAATIDTRDEKRDGHLRSPDFLEVESHPAITFKSTRVVAKGGDNYDVHGVLTIRGISRDVVLKTEYNGQSTAPWGSQVIGFSAETKINRKDYGLVWNAALETGGFVVGDDVKIALEVEAIKQA